MPTYQYACTACEHRFETVQAFSDASLTECPECTGRLRKLYGSVGVVFKGSGFYRTDSRSGGKSETSSAPSSNGASSSGSSDSGSSKSESSSGTAKSDSSSSGSSSSSSGPSSGGSSSGTTSSSAKAS